MSQCQALGHCPRRQEHDLRIRHGPILGSEPPDQWFFTAEKDPGCRKICPAKPELISKLARSYDQWWDEVYPEMIAAGGDLGDPDQGRKVQRDKEWKGPKSDKKNNRITRHPPEIPEIGSLAFHDHPTCVVSLLNRGGRKVSASNRNSDPQFPMA